MKRKAIAAIGLTLIVGIALAVSVIMLSEPGREEAPRSVIVQGPDLATAIAAVESVGGEITHELGIIRAVGARLGERELREL
jgi:hypothetical protein